MSVTSPPDAAMPAARLACAQPARPRAAKRHQQQQAACLLGYLWRADLVLSSNKRPLRPFPAAAHSSAPLFACRHHITPFASPPAPSAFFDPFSPCLLLPEQLPLLPAMPSLNCGNNPGARVQQPIQ